MQLIPVIDLKGGFVVRGVAGQRSTYRPVESLLGCDATPESVARTFARQFGFKSCYVADLDAIAGAKPDWSAYAVIARHLPNLIIDAGVNDAGSLVELFPPRSVSEESEKEPRSRVGLGKAQEAIVIGLESLTSTEDLDLLVDAVGVDQAVFSLDLMAGRPITQLPQWMNSAPAKIVSDVVQAGFQRLIVLDLAQVGVGQGPTVLELCRELRQAHPSLQITSGGGVRGKSDLLKLADAGCDAALVASALHNGNLTPDDVGAFK